MTYIIALQRIFDSLRARSDPESRYFLQILTGRIFTALLFLAALCSPQLAHARAYTMPEGEGRVIVNAIWSESDKAFDGDGNAIEIADYQKTEVFAISEYGLTDDLTLILTPSFRSVSVDAAGADSSGLGYTELGGRYRLVNSGRLVVSAQATARIPGQRRRQNLAQIGSTDAEYDVRAQAGIALGNGSFAPFVILEGGYRFRDGDPANEFHIDATLGVRPTEKLLLLASSFNTISDGRGRGVFSDQRYHNLYLSGVYDITPRIALQAGMMGTLAGENALRERGLLLGLWFRF